MWWICIALAITTIFPKDAKGEMTEEVLKNHVVVLSSEIGERNHFRYAKLEAAADYITKEFKSYGYAPEFHTYEIANKTYRNIIATKLGKDRPDEIIIIGAHYDSVWGSPGADDNASSVAALLELSGRFASQDTERTIRFIAFTNEEPPLFLTDVMGSRVYAKECRRKKENIKAMICLESIGYYSDERGSQSYPPVFGFFYPDRANFIGVVGDLRSKRLVKLVASFVKRHSKIPVESIATFSFIPGVNFSDHDSFWRYGYQAVMITDTAFYRYDAYHTPFDIYEKLDYSRLSELVNGLFGMLVELDKHGKN